MPVADIQLTAHFRLSELKCRDGTPVPQELVQNARDICVRAEVLRTIVGPLKVLSGYRTPAWNRRQNGADLSQHLDAAALDLRSNRYSALELADIYQGLIDLRVVPDGGLGRYPGWIHIDLGRARRWSKGVE